MKNKAIPLLEGFAMSSWVYETKDAINVMLLHMKMMVLQVDEWGIYNERIPSGKGLIYAIILAG